MIHQQPDLDVQRGCQDDDRSHDGMRKILVCIKISRPNLLEFKSRTMQCNQGSSVLTRCAYSEYQNVVDGSSPDWRLRSI